MFAVLRNPLKNTTKTSLFSFSTDKLRIKNAAIVLAGSGVADGSEITEAVSLLISLSKLGSNIQCYAPNKQQKDVVNHVVGQPLSESRNVLIESARICRGNIKDLSLLSSKNYDAVFLPGGFGAAKNWSNFAEKGADFQVDSEIERVLKAFVQDKKPIGACCITPIILAKVFGANKVKLTLGQKTKEWEFCGTIGNLEFHLF